MRKILLASVVALVPGAAMAAGCNALSTCFPTALITYSSSLNSNTGGFTLTSQTSNQVLAAPNGSNGMPAFRALVAADLPTLTSQIDAAFGSAQGDILYRGASGWAALPPGTSGQVLQSGGSGANPSWATASSSSASAATIKAVTGAYTVLSTDCGNSLRSGDASAVTWTIPTGLPNGCPIRWLQGGAGVIAFAAGSGETLENVNSPANVHSGGQFARGELLIDTASTFALSGTTAP